MNTVAEQPEGTTHTAEGLRSEVVLAVGRSVRRHRIAADKSQMELALDAEIERSNVSRIERGVGNPSLLTLATLCHCLAITLPQLFEGITVTLPPTALGGLRRRENQASHEKKPAKGSRRSPLR